MKIITFATLKGGSGKTMNAFNIAGVLAENNRILLIDVDPQCNLSSNCGIDISDPKLRTIRDVLGKSSEQQSKPDEIIFQSPIQELSSLDIIPSSIMLFDTEMNMVNVTGRENFLKYYIDDYREYFENHYDYIIIDTNPSMSIININAFYVADSIILTSDVSTNSISGAELFCALWESKRKFLRKENNISALILCQYDRRTITPSRSFLFRLSCAAAFEKSFHQCRLSAPASFEAYHLPFFFLFLPSCIRTS